MVKSLRFLVSAALAVLAVDASAITENFGVLTSTPSVAFITYDVPGAIDDFFEFSIPLANVDAYAEEFGARSVNITGGEFTLFSGAPGSGTQVGVAFPFSNTADETFYTALPAGNYYFEVTGTANLKDAAYDFEASAVAVPEPGSVGLMLAGLALVVGTLLKRRAS